METDKEMNDQSPFLRSHRKPITITTQDRAAVGLFDSTHNLPLIICSQINDLDPIQWAKTNLSMIRSRLLHHGAILFRGFSLHNPERFRRLVEVISGSALPYCERTSPRTKVIENVYTSTDYPSNQSIFPHNENSYAITFPQKLFFWCEAPAQKGGETPLGDMRNVLARIDPSIVDEFVRKGWMYVRNFNAHFGLTWQTAFQTSDRAQVEDYCRKANIEWEWIDQGLQTRQVRPAVMRHPESNELVWFNHAAFFHLSSVEPALREWLLTEYGERSVPNNTYYGDGSPIGDQVIQHIRDAYTNEMVSFPWQRGDVVLIDNILTAHARATFEGNRRILVAMAEPYTRADLPAQLK